MGWSLPESTDMSQLHTTLNLSLVGHFNPSEEQYYVMAPLFKTHFGQILVEWYLMAILKIYMDIKKLFI